MTAWRKLRIRDIAVTYDGPHATPKSPKTCKSGPVFLGISSLQGGRLDLTQSGFLSEQDFISWTRRVTPRPGDVVFSYETRLGEAAIVPEGLQCALGRRLALMRPDLTKVDPRFLLYYYLGPEFQEVIRRNTVQGSTVDRIMLRDFPDFPIALPPLDEQRAIAAALGALDDKIESNRRLRQIMWDLLAAEYEQLSAGSELVEIRQLLSLEYGKSLPSVKRVSGDVPVYGSNGITGSHDKELIPGPGVIVGRKGSIGEVHWTHVASFPIDTTFYVSPMRSYPLLACYFALKNAELRNKNSDSAIPGLNREAALGTRVLAPTLKVAQNWNASRQEILGHLHHLDRENAQLTSLRDVLLPELLSGHVRVPEAREVVQEAVG